MATKEITPIQYAEYLNCTLQNITKHIRMVIEKDSLPSKRLPDVIAIKHYSRFYLLEVPENLDVKSIKKAQKDYFKRYDY